MDGKICRVKHIKSEGGLIQAKGMDVSACTSSR